MPKFEEWSPWVARPNPLHAPLTGAHKADIVIIGGGDTGLILKKNKTTKSG